MGNRDKRKEKREKRKEKREKSKRGVILNFLRKINFDDINFFFSNKILSKTCNS